MNHYIAIHQKSFEDRPHPHHPSVQLAQHTWGFRVPKNRQEDWLGASFDRAHPGRVALRAYDPGFHVDPLEPFSAPMRAIPLDLMMAEALSAYVPLKEARHPAGNDVF